MKNFFEKLIEELNGFDFPLFKLETEAEENKRLSDDLANRILDIRTQNYQAIMRDRLIPYVKDLELTESGILLTDNQLFERAHNLFCKAKKDGKLDDLNRIVEV